MLLIALLEVAEEEEDEPQEQQWGVPLVALLLVAFLGLLVLLVLVLPRSSGSSRHVFSPSFTTFWFGARGGRGRGGERHPTCES